LLAQRTAELERIDEENRQFVSLLSHDLRAPLVSLKGFVDELRLSLEDVETAIRPALPHLTDPARRALAVTLGREAPEALAFVESATARLSQLLGAVVRLARLGHVELHLEEVDMEALAFVESATARLSQLLGAVVRLARLGHVELHLEEVDMDALAGEVLESLAPRVRECGAAVTLSPLPPAMADRDALEQVLANLLANAVNYLDAARPGQIEVVGEAGPTETLYCIRDNGRGIAEEDRDGVFAPLRRAGHDDVPGERMGLAYVQALVRRHGGRLWFESEVGVGTTFSFALPRLPDAMGRSALREGE